MLKGTRNLSSLCRPTRKFASLARFTSRCAFTMRGISLDGNSPRFFAPELNSDLMFEGTRKLPALCRTARTVAMPKRVTYRCALTMGGISLNRNCLHFLVPELSSDFMLKRTSNLSTQSRLKRTVPALVRFISRCAFSMRGISLGGNYPRFLVPELSSHLILKRARNLSALCRPARTAATLARFTSRCAFTMRGISLDANCPHFLVPELNSDLMLNGTRNLSALCRPTPAIATLV